MTILSRALFFAIALGFTTAAYAQTDETSETAPPAEADAEPTAQAEADTSADEATPSEPAVGQSFVAGTFSDWEVQCLRVEEDVNRCQMYQLLKDQTGNSVAEVNLFAIPPGGPAEAGASVITPLETLLTADLRVSVDGGEVRRYPYSFCTTEGCVARLGFTAAEITEFKRGAEGRVTIVPALAPDQTVDLIMSLSGFTAAFDEMRRLSGL